jgi:hypothetical protein
MEFFQPKCRTRVTGLARCLGRIKIFKALTDADVSQASRFALPEEAKRDALPTSFRVSGRRREAYNYIAPGLADPDRASFRTLR